MVSAKTLQVINRLIAIHARSLASYLTYASPTWHRGDEHAKETLESIAEQQREMVDRLGEWVVEHDGMVDYGSYPMVFTAYHDLSFDFLLDKLIACQQQDVAAIEAYASQLDEMLARELAQESLGEAKAHYDALLELRQHASAA
jgi:hypothetical protein